MIWLIYGWNPDGSRKVQFKHVIFTLRAQKGPSAKIGKETLSHNTLVASTKFGDKNRRPTSKGNVINSALDPDDWSGCSISLENIVLIYTAVLKHFYTCSIELWSNYKFGMVKRAVHCNTMSLRHFTWSRCRVLLIIIIYKNSILYKLVRSTKPTTYLLMLLWAQISPLKNNHSQ